MTKHLTFAKSTLNDHRSVTNGNFRSICYMVNQRYIRWQLVANFMLESNDGNMDIDGNDCNARNSDKRKK